MKILFLNHNLIWRGTFFRCLGFARELVKAGHRVDLWTASREPHRWGTREPIDGVAIWQTPRWGRLGRHDGGYAPLDNLTRVGKALGGEWDIVHAFDHRPNVLSPWLLLRARDAVWRRSTLFCSDWCDWWTCGGITTGRRRWPWIDRVEQVIEEKSKAMSDGVTVISSVLRDRAERIGIEGRKLHLLPAGVDIGQFPLRDRYQCRRELAWPEQGPYLGFVGFSLWDMALLADAFAIIKKQVKSAKLVVVGGGVEESAKEVFAHRFQVNRDVYLPGVVPFAAIPQYLGACDIQLLPMQNTLANQARIPNKLVDYFASGRPCVASNVGDTGKYVEAHEAGLVAGESAESLAERCLELVDRPQSAREYGEKARYLAATRFSYSTLTKSLISFYSARRSGG